MSYQLSAMLKNYRKEHKLTQADLAELLYVDVRTVRRYESTETVIRDIDVLTNIARVLGIDTSLLGITTIDKDGDDTSVANDLWDTVKNAQFKLARDKSERLLIAGNTGLNTLYAIAYVFNHTSSNKDASIPLALYRRVYDLAKERHDLQYQTLGLTYMGDMEQRLDRVKDGIETLREAIKISPDLSLKGNAEQLLARAYGKAGNDKDFDRAIKSSLDTAYKLADTPYTFELSSSKSNTRGQFGLATAYEEYAKYEGLHGNVTSALELLDKAEIEFNRYWSKERSSMLLTSTRAIAYIKADDFKTGSELAIEGIALCEQYGNRRNLERIIGIMHYLDNMSREAHKSSMNIRERLTGKGELY